MRHNRTMTASPGLPELSYRTAALCRLLGRPAGTHPPEVRAAAERAKELLRSGAGPDELSASYDDLDHALRRAGVAGGLTIEPRHVSVPGVAKHTKLALCPGPARCSRTESVRFRLPPKHCAVNDARMHKARLDPEQ